MGKSNAGKHAHQKKYYKRPQTESTKKKLRNRRLLNKEKERQPVNAQQMYAEETAEEFYEEETNIEDEMLKNKYTPVGVLDMKEKTTLSVGVKLNDYLTGRNKTITQHVSEYGIKDVKELEELVNNASSTPLVNEDTFSFLSIEKENVYKIIINTYAKGITIKYHLIREHDTLMGRIRYVGHQNTTYLARAKERYEKEHKIIDDKYLETLMQATKKVNKNI